MTQAHHKKDEMLFVIKTVFLSFSNISYNRDRSIKLEFQESDGS